MRSITTSTTKITRCTVAALIAAAMSLTAVAQQPGDKAKPKAKAKAKAKAQPRAVERDGVVVERDVQYGTAGDRALKLDVIRPKEASAAPRPAIVWIHGGGWRGGDKSSGARRLAAFAASGNYVCFSVGYRLSGEATWPAQIHDCKAAIRWIKANASKHGVDPKRVGVWGSSAGGHLVSLLGTSGGVKDLEGANGSSDASSTVACVVDYCGPSDFVAFAEQSPGAGTARSAISGLFGGTVKEKHAEAVAASPVTHVTKDDPPFLIVHGTKDPLVPLAQAEGLHAALQKAGCDVTFIKMDGGGHGIGGEAITRRVATFFDIHLLGAKEKLSSEAIKVGARR